MVRASASQSVDLGFISKVESYQDFKKWYSQLPCLALSINKDSVENKSASLLVVSLGKALNGNTSFMWQNDDGAKQSTSLTKDLQTESER